MSCGYIELTDYESVNKMESFELMPVVGLSMLILAGGLVGSFGANSVVRSGMGRAFVIKWRWWGVAIYYL